MKIAVIGGGLMGLALAWKLARQGHSITVFERDNQLGGLTTHHDYGSFTWDRFYHVILPSDTHLLDFLREIGLGDKLRWTKTLTGFYIDRKFYSMSTSLEFLKFPPLSLIGKFRLGLTILYCARIKNWQRLEKIPVEHWLRKFCGRETFEKMWRPLLLAKLGEHYKRVSAVFIWSYIRRMYSARDSSAQKETLGYVSGGYKTVFDRLNLLLTEKGSEVRKGCPTRSITATESGKVEIEHENGVESFDRAVYTGPVGLLDKLVSPDIVAVERSGSSVEYLGVICFVLVTRVPLQPYYVLNIADDRIPFTGLIGMSNLVSTEETGGLHLTYLPRYVHYEDPLLNKSDDELREEFFQGLDLMFPDLDKSVVESVHINRAARVQPLQVLNYSALVPSVVTKHDAFMVLNTSQFVNNTLNNNEVIRAVDEFSADFHPAFS